LKLEGVFEHCELTRCQLKGTGELALNLFASLGHAKRQSVVLCKRGAGALQFLTLEGCEQVAARAHDAVRFSTGMALADQFVRAGLERFRDLFAEPNRCPRDPVA